MKRTYIDNCIQEALQGNIVHLHDNLYLLSSETALHKKLIPENICSIVPFWIIGDELPRPIEHKQELESLFTWHKFFTEFANNADEFKDFNPRGG